MPKKKKEAKPTVLLRPDGSPVTPRVPGMQPSARQRADPDSPLSVLRPSSRLLMCSDTASRPVPAADVRRNDTTSLLILEGHDHAVTCVLELADARIVTGSLDNCLRVWTLWKYGGCCDKVIEAHVGGVTCLAQLSDSRVASGSTDKSIRIWNIDNQGLEAKLEHADQEVAVLSVFSNGNLFSGGEDGIIRLWDISSGTAHRVGKPIVVKSEALDHHGRIISIQELPGGRVLTSAWDGDCKLWDCCEPTEEDPQGVHWTILITVRGKCPVMLSEQQLACISFADLNVPHSLWTWVFEITDTPKDDDDIAVEQPKPRHDRSLKGHTGVVTGLIRLSKGQLLSWGDDATMRLWSARSLGCKLTFKEHTQPITQVIQLQQGALQGALLSCSWDRKLRVWRNPQHHT